MNKQDLINLIKKEIKQFPLDEYNDNRLTIKDYIESEVSIGDLFLSNIDGGFYFVLQDKDSSLFSMSISDTDYSTDIEDFCTDDLIYLYACVLKTVIND